MKRNPFSGIATNSHAPLTRTVALRGEPSISAISDDIHAACAHEKHVIAVIAVAKDYFARIMLLNWISGFCKQREADSPGCHRSPTFYAVDEIPHLRAVYAPA